MASSRKRKGVIAGVMVGFTSFCVAGGFSREGCGSNLVWKTIVYSTCNIATQHREKELQRIAISDDFDSHLWKRFAFCTLNLKTFVLKN